MFANIIIDIAHEKVDRTFQYRIPEELEGRLEVGMLVEAPFGKGNHLRRGYVLALTDRAEFPVEAIKPLAGIVQTGISVEQHFLQLAQWMYQNYGSTMIQCLKTVLPVRERMDVKEQRYVRLCLKPEEVNTWSAHYQKKNSKAKLRLLTALAQRLPEPVLDYRMVTGMLHISASTLRTMEKEQVIAVQTERAYRNPVAEPAENPSAGWSHGQPEILNGAQQYIVEEMRKEFDANHSVTALLHGVTGSGKTAVYIALAEEVVCRGRQVIVLIPEIALTYQTVMRFYARFGGRVSILNSRMSKGERSDQFERARKGELDVMIGPRSALFTPFMKLGLIVIDEEHEPAYKSETMPRYHAREVAVWRAKMLGAVVLLGSATPSVESYYRAKQGEYRLFELKERHGDATLPAVSVVDLRQELKSGNRSMFSGRLRTLMSERLKNNEQTMLFLNRRGYAGFLSCRSCGAVVECPHCDVSLSLHRDGRLYCHYCGYETAGIRQCPACGSKYIGTFKAGTQQIEEQVTRLFPGARVLRMDMDTTRHKNAHQQILEQFASGKADILVGTQMIVKGHDFPNVTLVGVLAADLSLAVSDYRAAERTFQLLEQAAGRAGRSGKPGEVVIQTYQPEHYAIQSVCRHDYQRFYEEEMSYRSLMGYPPVQELLALHVSGEQEEHVKKTICHLTERVRKHFPEVWCLGPAPQAIARMNDLYRFTVYFKQEDRQMLIAVRRNLEFFLEAEPAWTEGLSVQFDPDPV